MILCEGDDIFPCQMSVLKWSVCGALWQSQYRILRLNKRLPVTPRTKLADVVREVGPHHAHEHLIFRHTGKSSLISDGNKFYFRSEHV